MGKSRQSANLVSDNNIFVDVTNDRVGIGSTTPKSKLDVNGTASITSLNVTGVSTLTSLNVTGVSTLTSLNVTGVSTLTSLNVTGVSTLTSLNVTGVSTLTSLNVTGIVTATSFRGDGSQLTGVSIGDLYELDSISPAGLENTYTPTFNYDTVSVTDPFSLLITVNGILQSAYVHNTEYVYNNYLLASRTGYTIDYDGKIKFTEALPEGSEVVIKTTAGTTKSTTRRYPFNALDILF